jgi:hypothetical protein
MKIFRPVPGQAGFYQVVGHSGPRTITAGGTAGNTIPADVPVKAGDLLGFHTLTTGDCIIPVLGETGRLFFFGDLSDGQSGGPFGSEGGSRLDIEANFVPDNGFSLSGVRRNRKKGSVSLSFSLPNPGELAGSGMGAKVSSQARTSKAVGAGPAQLLVKAKGKKKAALNATGKVKLRVSITYTPTGGDPSTQSVKVKLVKR